MVCSMAWHGTDSKSVQGLYSTSDLAVVEAWHRFNHQKHCVIYLVIKRSRILKF